MAVFNVNQNRHLYVAKSFVDVSSSAFPEDAATGTIGLKAIDNGMDKELYFVYKGVDASYKSDMIPVKNISSVKAVAAKDMVTPFKSYLVALNPDINDGEVVVGQDYILRIVLRQWIGMSDEDVYFKEGVVHGTSDMIADPSKFYAKMKDSLDMAFSREIGASRYSNPYLSFEVTGDGLLITEKEQPWTQGIESQEQVMFEVVPTTIYVDGADVIWGKVENKTAKKAEVVVGDNGFGNGHKIADLEWFAMGERGDQYRYMGYPNYIPTKYLVDPNEQYHVLEIHFAFTDDGVNSYRSEKDITIVSADASVINSLVDAFNTATGKTVASIA